MHEETRALFKQAILASLPHLHQAIGQHVTHYLVWKKEGESQWRGEFEGRPDTGEAFVRADKDIKTVSEPFVVSFRARHPEHAGMVGIRGTLSNWGRDTSHLVRSALGYLWQRHGTFQVGEPEVEAVVQEFADFVDQPSVRLRFQTQLLNFRMPADAVDLPAGLRIRRLNEEEVSSLHGGYIGTLGFIRPQSSGIHEFVIEGETEEPKLLGDNHPEGVMIAERLKETLDEAVLALRSFKAGHIGYDYIHFHPFTFCPLPLGSRGSGDRYVPFGTYALSAEEIEPLREHAALIFACKEPSMEMACARLADAETRTRPQDQAVDAVVGLEAILLAGLSKEDRRGELSYRFSMRYASLFGTPEERHAAYRVARDLYTLRSIIAHGSAVEQKHRVGDEKLKLDAAARRAVDVLRSVVRRFLPVANAARYKKPEFWDRAVFGLPEQQ